jgi:hypothetical protein
MVAVAAYGERPEKVAGGARFVDLRNARLARDGEKAANGGGTPRPKDEAPTTTSLAASQRIFGLPPRR